MTDAPRLQSVPDTTAAATKSSSSTSGCADCGWPFGPDLALTWVLGRPLLLCTNPWKCRERQSTTEEYLSRILN